MEWVGRTVHAECIETHVIKCDCDRTHLISEYKEPVLNDRGRLTVECRQCKKQHRIWLKTNVDGASLSVDLSLIDVDYDD